MLSTIQTTAASSCGFADWNRYRNDTFKDNRDAELPYILSLDSDGQAAAAAAAAAENVVKERPLIYSEFEQVGTTGVHMQKKRGGGPDKAVSDEYWRCRNTSGTCKLAKDFKFHVVAKATGKLFTHLKMCKPQRHLEISLGARLQPAYASDTQLPCTYRAPRPAPLTCWAPRWQGRRTAGWFPMATGA